MAIETTITTAPGPQTVGLRGAWVVLLVVAGITTGLLIGRVAWQENPVVVNQVPAAAEVSSFEDYALRHAGDTASSSAQIVRTEDYALRHGAISEGANSSPRPTQLEDYALRHPTR